MRKRKKINKVRNPMFIRKRSVVIQDKREREQKRRHFKVVKKGESDDI